LVERLFGISITLPGGLALLTRFQAAALLLTRLLARRLFLLAGLDLVRHVVSFHGSGQPPRTGAVPMIEAAIRIVAIM
jgi:hypothetical protein